MNCSWFVGVDTETGKIVEVKPNEEQGTVFCDRVGPGAINALKFHYHPKRINHALKRVGERGEDKWEEISYDQALDEIAAKLAELKEQYGPETLVVSEGTCRSDHLWARSRFSNLFGNPGNLIDPGSICWCWTYTVNMSMCGWPLELAMPVTPEHARTIILWGTRRPGEVYGPQSPLSRQFKSLLSRDGWKPRIITIDPVCAGLAPISEPWLNIYPGTDVYLALTWINIVLENEWYNKDFLKYWSNAVFLVRKSDNHIIRTEDVAENGNNDDFVVWDAITNGPVFWNSDENHYFNEEVDAQLSGDYEITLKDGTKALCYTAFDALKERMKDYTLDKCETITGLERKQIIEAIRAYACDGPATMVWGVGASDMHGINSVYGGVARTILRILTGNVDNLGGDYIGEPGPVPVPGEGKTFPKRDAEFELADMVSPETRKKLIGNDLFKVMSWVGFEPVDKNYRKMWDIPRPQVHQLLVSTPLVYDAILKDDPYPVRAMIAWGSNPLAWAPNTKKLYEALKKLDLLVVLEYWKTPTAALADYILPAADCFERPLATSNEDGTDFTLYGDRAVPPLYDRRMDFDFFMGLGKRLGQEEYWPWETYEDTVEEELERVPNFDYQDAMNQTIYFPCGAPQVDKYTQTLPNGQTRGFCTRSRKCELFVSFFEDIGYDPLPSWSPMYESPYDTPEVAEEYPLRLTVGGRWSPMYHSEWRVPGQGTRSMFPWPTFNIHYNDARALGVRDNEWCWIETARGRIRQRAKIGWDIKEGVVACQSHWWFPELPAEEPWSQGIFESNGNLLCPDDPESLDPLAGNWVTRGLLCKVYPCIDPADRSEKEISLETFLESNTFYDRSFNHLAFNELKKMDQ
jgi:anaerobic selenocysteine-containing dehydrogenase